VSVRVNELSTPWAGYDLAVCAGLPGLDSVVLPKTQTAQDLLDVDRILKATPIGIQALIETPQSTESHTIGGTANYPPCSVRFRDQP
jgi:citrate lyase beta subunit